MRLTRRDALAVASFLGAAVGGGVALDRAADAGVLGDELADSSGTTGAATDGDGETAVGTDVDEETLATLVAVGEVVYPERVKGIAEFVTTYTEGRLLAEPDREAAVVAAAAELDEVADEWEDAAFADLDRETRDELLRELAVDTSDPDPEGIVPERIRYYLVNDLLYAFYASPSGSELVGTPNPIGYPGGYRTALSPDHRRASPTETRDPTAELGESRNSNGGSQRE